MFVVTDSGCVKQGISPVKKMPLLFLTEAYPAAPVNYFFTSVPTMPLNPAGPPRIPNGMMVTSFARPRDLCRSPGLDTTAAALTACFVTRLWEHVHWPQSSRGRCCQCTGRFCVEINDGTGTGFVFQTLITDQRWHLNTRSSLLYHVRIKIITSSRSSPYSEILQVSGIFKAPGIGSAKAKVGWA